MHETVINTEIDGKSVGVTVKREALKQSLKRKIISLFTKLILKQ